MKHQDYIVSTKSFICLSSSTRKNGLRYFLTQTNVTLSIFAKVPPYRVGAVKTELFPDFVNAQSLTFLPRRALQKKCPQGGRAKNYNNLS